MRWRVVLSVSLGLNVVLGLFWLISARRYQAEMRNAAGPARQPADQVRTNVIVRRHFFTWSQVESSDYPTYIANLRSIDCPEQTIRDIIIADVNELYARRLATELVTPEQQWWRSEPDPTVAKAAADKTREIEEERRALLARLLGPDWEARDLASLPRPTHPGVLLDGPVLGALPEEVRQAVQDISARAQDRLQAYLAAQRQLEKAPDPVELAKLRLQTRAELTQTLTPQQLEEYLLRYSQNANNLRAELGRLKYFNAGPEDFRALFRATDPVDQQLELLAGRTDPSGVALRNTLLKQRDNAIKLALGPQRFEQYVLLQDPAYQNAYAAAQQAGTPEAAPMFYQINVASAEQLAAIRANTNLTPQQMAVESRRLEWERAMANAIALGQEIPPDPAPAPTNPAPSTPPIRSHGYVLGTGESVNTIATLFGVPIDAIKAANPGVDLRKLRPGDVVRVPDTLPSRLRPGDPLRPPEALP